jgi:Phage tail baseplate hub (GPD)
MAPTNSPSTQYFQWQDATANSTFSVSFPKNPNLELVLIGAELYQDIEQHDRLVLHFKGKPFVKGTEIHSGDPVTFKYQAEKVKATWTGYVHTPVSINGLKANNTDVICVGASYLLKNPDQKVYTNVTADQCIVKLANKHGMKATTQRHPRKRSSIVQAGVSDWQFCKRLAAQTGFALRADNTTIIFMSKDKLYNDHKNNAPYFYYVDDPQGGVATKSDKNLGTVLNFQAYPSDEAPELELNVDRTITGTNVSTGKPIKVTHKRKKANTSTKGAVKPGTGFFK